MTQMDLSAWMHGLVPRELEPDRDVRPANMSLPQEFVDSLSEAEPEPARKGRPSIEERFATFHAANPHVLAEALRLAREHLARGATRVGVKALYEELRTSIQVRKLGEYKLNNDYTPCLARALIEAEPRLVGVIETRQRRAR